MEFPSWFNSNEPVTMWFGSLALLSGLRIQCCCELWSRSQKQLGSRVALAVAQASDYSSDWTPSLGTSIYHGQGHKKTERPPQKKKKKRPLNSCVSSSLSKDFQLPHRTRLQG